MKFEQTIKNINQELISGFAMLDSWFDRTCDDFDEIHDDTFEVIKHLLDSNTGLLNGIPGVSNDAKLRYLTEDRQVLRSSLRDQLFDCLLVVDMLEKDLENNNATSNDSLEVIERLWVIIHHLRYHVEELEAEIIPELFEVD